MSSILFATLDAGGNVPPALGIGAELARRGHRVRVLSHEPQRDAVRSAGLEFVAYRNSPRLEPRQAQSTFTGLGMFISVLTSRAIGDDLLEAVSDVPADVAVIDCMLLGAIDAAASVGLTHAVLFHSFRSYFDGRWRHGPIGMVGRLKGMGAQGLWRSADAELVCTERDLDPKPVAQRHYVGAIHDVTAPAQPQTPPRVLASLSTLNFPGQQQVWQNILDAAADLPIELVATTGPAVDPDALLAPSNAVVHRYVPHAQLMPICSAVIGHGGHATAVRALAHGLPLLILPMHPLLDQQMVGDAIHGAGAAITLKKNAKTDQIRAALDELTTADGYRYRAAELGRQIRENNATVTAADRLLELAITSNPRRSRR